MALDATTAYITREELENHIDTAGGVGGITAVDLVNLEIAIEATSRWLDDHFGTSFYARTETRYFTAEYPDLLYIDDLLTVTTLKSDDDGDDTFETTWTASTDYRLEPRNAALGSQPKPYRQLRVNINGSYTFPVNVRDGVEIAGTWGYCTLANIPDHLKQFVLLMSHRLWARKTAIFGVSGTPALGVTVVQAKITADADLMLLLTGVDRRGW